LRLQSIYISENWLTRREEKEESGREEPITEKGIRDTE